MIFALHVNWANLTGFPLILHFPKLQNLWNSYIDIWEPAPLKSKNGFKFYILFVDDFSRYTWIYPLKGKNKALATFV